MEDEIGLYFSKVDYIIATNLVNICKYKCSNCWTDATDDDQPLQPNIIDHFSLDTIGILKKSL